MPDWNLLNKFNNDRSLKDKVKDLTKYSEEQTKEYEKAQRNSEEKLRKASDEFENDLRRTRNEFEDDLRRTRDEFEEELNEAINYQEDIDEINEKYQDLSKNLIWEGILELEERLDDLGQKFNNLLGALEQYDPKIIGALMQIIESNENEDEDQDEYEDDVAPLSKEELKAQGESVGKNMKRPPNLSQIKLNK